MECLKFDSLLNTHFKTPKSGYMTGVGLQKAYTIMHKDFYYFSRHVKIHTAKESFSCPDCNKTFTLKCNLKVHLKLHTGSSKPFVCSECDKSFLKNDDSKIRSAEKSFSCSYCNKSFFRQKTYLTAHVKSHCHRKLASCWVLKLEWL